MKERVIVPLYKVERKGNNYVVVIDGIEQHESYFPVELWTKEEVLVQFEQKTLKNNA